MRIPTSMMRCLTLLTLLLVGSTCLARAFVPMAQHFRRHQHDRAYGYPFDPQLKLAPVANYTEEHSIAGDVVVVTGGSNGVGNATVHLFVNQGCTVYFIDMLDPTTPVPYGATFIKADLAQFDQVEAAVMKIRALTSKVDHLILNAGRGWAGFFDDTDVYQIIEFLKGDIFGHMHLYHLIKNMIPISLHSRVMFTGSIASIIVTPGLSVYNMAKVLVDEFAKTLIMESPNNFQVVVLKPDEIDTLYWKHVVNITHTLCPANVYGINEFTKEVLETLGQSPNRVAEAYYQAATTDVPWATLAVLQSELPDFNFLETAICSSWVEVEAVTRSSFAGTPFDPTTCTPRI